MEMREVLLYFSCKYEGDMNNIMFAINNKEDVDLELLEKFKKLLTCDYITLLDKDYPNSFKYINKPPFVIYYKGDKKLLNKENKIAIIGSRNNTNYGRDVCKEIVPFLVLNEVTIVSGLAKGIDGISQELTLLNNGKTIGVIGGGFDYFYPKENIDLFNNIINNGLVISEYPSFTRPSKDKFLRRNQLIAGLSDKIIVVEAYKRSGTLNTVMHGLEQGKDIYCVPNQMFKQSICNTLIKEGAFIVTKKEDILI